ncbi:DTW domain-containing protein [Bordetella genomosp. 1]|uniref:tRNA-uridine aminocarboxypropyltransferase n=1 Tax=Bordetella genomosp. 1 TaxID=1395607 RepID=A0A261S7M8_9BORD|nr:tRNA-uridine aminocarboxypropyltransferase [Bordetella genomosp. 1]OZI32780.1 DTW domain-containing protein [Bordetella genomosp. 1]
MPRPVCPRCLRPLALCLCSAIPALRNRVRVLVLQHPDEARHALNTARLAVLGLAHAEMVVGKTFDASLWQRPGCESWLLFPGEDAVPASTLAARLAQGTAQAPEKAGEIQLVVPDGTWRHARGMLRDHPALAALPRITLDGVAQTRYRVRHADAEGAVSSIEAVAAALNALEGTRQYDALLAPFERLVAQQIAAMGEEVYQRHHVARCGSRGGAA